jgi:hypothetical protein
MSRPPLANPLPQTYVRGLPGDWRSDFRFAWQTPAAEPDEGPGLTWRELTPPPPLVGDLGFEVPGPCHPRRRRVGRLPPPRGPARPLADHHRRPVRHGRGRAGGGRRGVVGEVTHAERQFGVDPPGPIGVDRIGCLLGAGLTALRRPRLPWMVGGRPAPVRLDVPALDRARRVCRRRRVRACLLR